MGPSPDPHAPRRILVVAYYFPPMGLSGVQRVSRFVKYLPDFGWHPTVLTVRPGGYFAFDPTLEADLQRPEIEVVRTRSADPTRLFRGGRPVTLPREGVRSAFSTVSQFLLLPDNKIGWYPAAVRTGLRLLREKPYQAILSSAPPYTAHLVGAALKRRTGLPLVLDFRDDWVGNPRHVYPTPLHRSIQQRQEHRVMGSADAVIAINRHILENLRRRNPGSSAKKGFVIPQGFDPKDFPTGRAHEKGSHFVLTYTGVFYDAQRPDVLFRAVARLVEGVPELRNRIRLEFAGTLPEDSLALAKELGILPMIDFRGYLDHAQVVGRMREADVLWMTVGRRPGAEGISTGKLFEYFGSRKPILALVPEGEARHAVLEYGASRAVDTDDVGAAAAAIEAFFREWEAGTLASPAEAFVQRFDRRRLTGELASLCDKLSDRRS
ncbi:MAG TPA: glycosyltransferase family 4 protein [Rhodothermales bacterium]